VFLKAHTSNAGGLLLLEVEEQFGILRPFVEAFVDHRSPENYQAKPPLNSSHIAAVRRVLTRLSR
jgi:hypothetical protein